MAYNTSILEHPKFLRLRRELRGHHRNMLRGCLEQIWDTTHATLNPVFQDPTDIEMIVDWDGDDGAFLAALLKAGFLDKIDGGGVAVHDFEDWLPYHARERRRKRDEYRVRRDAKTKPHSKRDHSDSENFTPETQKSPGDFPETPGESRKSPGHSPYEIKVKSNERGVSEGEKTDSLIFQFQSQSPDKPVILKDADVAKYAARYPGVDIPGELKRLQFYLEDATDEKRPKASGMRSWITSCLNKSRPTPPVANNGKPDHLDREWAEAIARI